ncbi:MAG: Queuine tRNA-ribosyltransferase [Planctomycetota bacterium]|jgi:queuine tRNA-ribosyltransferase
MAVRLEILQRSSENGARLGRVHTPHGAFDTPAFMPVATAAAMKGLTPEQVRSTGSQIILNNTLHCMLRPGAERIAKFGSSHAFMRWNGPILTDSGGFQAFSMADIRTLDDDGVTFSSFVDGAKVRMTPEVSIRAQNLIGADIIMAFDDCPPAAAEVPMERVREAMHRSVAWLHRCKAAHARPDAQALFGIVQGGTHLELRKESAARTCEIELPGYAIGGVAVGESPERIADTVRFTAPLLPDAKPRYLMGVGYPRDIAIAVAAGVDMFDCVLPTRNGRNALAFTREGALRLRNARFADDQAPIEADCDCQTCAGGFSRAYLRHLFSAGEMLGPTLVSLHNVRLYQRLMLAIRRAIGCNAWSALETDWPCLSAAREQTTGDPE